MILIQDAIGGFGKWLLFNILSSGYDVSSFCDMHNLSRKTVYNHIYRRSKPNMQTIKHYCEIFGTVDHMWRVYETMVNDWDE